MKKSIHENGEILQVPNKMDLVREIDVPVGCYWPEEDSFEFTFGK
jgi:hypothetical protein